MQPQPSGEVAPSRDLEASGAHHADMFFGCSSQDRQEKRSVPFRPSAAVPSFTTRWRRGPHADGGLGSAAGLLIHSPTLLTWGYRGVLTFLLCPP